MTIELLSPTNEVMDGVVKSMFQLQLMLKAKAYEDRLSVLIDGKRVSRKLTSNGMYIKEELLPGRHTIRVERDHELSGKLWLLFLCLRLL